MSSFKDDGEEELRDSNSAAEEEESEGSSSSTENSESEDEDDNSDNMERNEDSDSEESEQDEQDSSLDGEEDDPVDENEEIFSMTELEDTIDGDADKDGIPHLPVGPDEYEEDSSDEEVVNLMLPPTMSMACKL